MSKRINMINSPTLRAGCLLVFAVIQLCHLHAQAAGQDRVMPRVQAQAASLQQFFETLATRNDSSPLPSHEELLTATDQIADAHPEDISKALPAVFVAFRHANETVRSYAYSALFRIARRPDGATLLKNWIDSIGQNLLTSDSETAQRSAAMILSSLRPAPPTEVWRLFVRFVKRTDRNPQAQSAAIDFLVRYGPDKPNAPRLDPTILEAIKTFFARPLDAKDRIGALHAIAGSRVLDPGLIDLAIASVDDPDQRVRLTAINALTRMGRPAVLQAEPALQKIIEHDNGPAELKTAAKKALQSAAN